MSGAAGFSWRMLRRGGRAGELRVLLAALVVAVASVTAVGFFTDRVRGAMEQQAGELLAADRVVESTRPLDPAWRRRAQELGLTTAEVLSFRSVVLAGEQLQLAEVKAVEPAYPLRGELRIAQQAFGAEQTVPHGPPPGRAWAEPRLLQSLAIAPGATVNVGELSLTLEAVLAWEPDRGGEMFSIAPRLLMNQADVAATGLIQPGSLVHYRLLLAGPAPALERFADWIRPQLGESERLLGVRDARPELTAALDRAETYLGLAALVSVLLAGVAVATAANRYARRQLDASAVMRCLGASQRFLATTFALQLLWLALAGTVLGALVGFAAHQVIVSLFGVLFSGELPAPSLLPLLYGLLTALVTLGGFALPPILALQRVPPLRVLRQDLLPVPPSARRVYGGAAAALALLMALQSGDLTLTAVVLVGSVATLALLAAAAWGLVAALRRLRGGAGVAWRFGLAALTRRPRAAVAQVVAFGLGIAVLLLLSLVRTDLLAQWRDRLPEDAPNQFLINVQAQQVAEVRAFFAERGRPEPGLFPMVRGRLVAINDRAVSAADYSESRAQRLVQREFNLSWRRTLPDDNRVVAGAWWPGSGRTAGGEWSVEQGLAETLGIALGDRLVFNVGGQRVSGRVSSLRALEWDSFNVNFFVLAPPGVLDEYPASYITAFHLPAADKPLVAELVRQFPNVTVIDVEALMTRVRGIMDRVALAVQFVFVFTLAAGFTVLFAAIQASRDERLREAAVLRTLGAQRRQILGGLVVEFAVLGAAAGLLAAAAASGLAAALALWVFDFAYRFDPGVWLVGGLGGAIGVGLAGLAGTRSVLSQPPLWTLRRL